MTVRGGEAAAGGARRAGGTLRWLGSASVDVVLWVLGGLGLLSLVAAGCAHFWGLTLILFSTGSMSPSIPAGSAALVQRIPASQIRVGDVVTVERRNAMPITHRVTSIAPAPSGNGAYLVTMKGDANELADPNPYQVVEVQRVLGSAPGIAAVIQMARDPRVLAGITLIAAGLVVWAFWPRRRHAAARVLEGAEPAQTEAAGGAQLGSAPAADDEAADLDQPRGMVGR